MAGAADADKGERQMASRELMLIDGKWTASVDGRFFPVENPAIRGSVIAEVPRARFEDVDRAVQAAASAFRSWKKVAARERGKLLIRIAEEMEAQEEEIARTTAMETGNALRTQSRPEAKQAVDLFRYLGGVAGEIK